MNILNYIFQYQPELFWVTIIITFLHMYICMVCVYVYLHEYGTRVYVDICYVGVVCTCMQRPKVDMCLPLSLSILYVQAWSLVDLKFNWCDQPAFSGIFYHHIPYTGWVTMTTCPEHMSSGIRELRVSCLHGKCFIHRIQPL